MNLSIRARLTLWFLCALALALVASGGALHVAHERALVTAVDDDLARAGGLVARLVAAELDEGAELPQAAAESLEDIGMPDRRLAVFDTSGTRLAGDWDGLPTSLLDGVHERSVGGVRVRLARHEHRGVAFVVASADPLVAVEREMSRLRRTLAAVILVPLLLSAAGGFWIARSALHPLTTLAGQARAIDAARPGSRLRAPNPDDELGHLAATFNDLLDRLERVLEQQRQFMADASHELRTPVSVARSAAEVTLARPERPPEEYRDALEVAGRQARRLSRIVDDLFTLARADAGGLALERRPLDLEELLQASAADLRVLGARRSVAVDVACEADLPASGDERWLQRLFVNLLENAVRHSPESGRVRVIATTRDGAVEVDVTDEGPGIPAPDQDRVFDRFVRLDSSRHGEGAGLGLAIVRTVALAHGGTAAVARSDSTGTTFRVRLPR